MQIGSSPKCQFLGGHVGGEDKENEDKDKKQAKVEHFCIEIELDNVYHYHSHADMDCPYNFSGGLRTHTCTHATKPAVTAVTKRVCLLREGGVVTFPASLAASYASW